MANWEHHWKDYYDILKLDRNASFDEIKKAFKNESRLNHPDLHPEASDEEKAEYEAKQQLINEAYSVLSDETTKKEYDAVWDSKKNGTYKEEVRL